MSDEAQHSDGRRMVGLYLPFTAAGLRIEAITFEPCTFGHLLRWQAGAIPSSIALMMELSKRTLHEIETIRYPDDSRVMAAFLDHIHPTIADDIRAGVRPRASGEGGDDRGPEPQDAVYGPDGAPLAPSGGTGALDPFSRYDEFETVPTERPLDYVEGLDP